ncbi:MAG: type II toxin-antitoxin system death-on-curing family toxin [Sphingobium sp.]
MDGEPIWLTFEDVRDIHISQIDRFGGLGGIRNENLVHSATAAPQNLFHYEGIDDPLTLGIRLCFAIARNHGFSDGNKRTATVAMIEFLAINGWDLVIPDDEPETPLLGQWVEKLISDALTSEQFYERLVHFIQERP